MELSFKDYRDKLSGCWYGKNIGGTLGAPFECSRGVFEFDFYTQDLNGEPAPNDDLDLQLVWLNAVERFGRAVNASILGEYWLSYITPSWSEYGQAKNNLRMGISPPLSGFLNNANRDSCGAFIRSELWAALCPGRPDIAVKYAFEDATVDHSFEGVYAAVFCAALQSAAFAVSDRETLIDTALSYIPADCAIARVVGLVRKSYNDGVDWKECRKQILINFPGMFGLAAGYGGRQPEPEIPKGRLGYDAPSNIGIMILGWYYGNGDFGKSLCIAAGCGEDADCTAATLGALFGIINGYSGLPQKWIKPIGNKIKTLSINEGDHDCKIPKTIEELTDRILKLTPVFLGTGLCRFSEDNPAYTIIMKEPEKLGNTSVRKGLSVETDFSDIVKRQPFSTRHTCPVAELVLDYIEPPYIKPLQEKRFILRFENLMRSQQWLKITAYAPEGFVVSPSPNLCVSLEQNHGNDGVREIEIRILTPEVLYAPKYEVLLDITFNGRHTRLFAPITLLNSPEPEIDRE
jgi:ADP-ribosylglycohydrolase